MRPVLEQAAAAALAVTDAAGTAKAQAAAKKAKRLTPQEMKQMRQQADPHFGSKDAGAGTSQTASQKAKAKAKLAKAAAAAAAAASASVNVDVAQVQSAAAEASLPVEQHMQQPSKAEVTRASVSKPVSITAEAPAQSKQPGSAVQPKQQGNAVSGSKRHHGLGFVEGQPSSKRLKGEEDSRAGTDNTVAGPQPAQAETKAQLEVTGSTWQAESSSSVQAPFPGPGSGQAEQQQGPGQGKSQPGQGNSQPGQGQQQAGQRQQQQRQSQQATGTDQQQAGHGHSEAPTGPPVVFTDECTAFVRGLDSKVTDAELQALLAPCGDVKDVRIVLDKVTNRPKVSSSAEAGPQTIDPVRIRILVQLAASG